MSIQGLTGRSWLLGDALTGDRLLTLVTPLHELAGATLVAAALSIAFVPGWWRPLAIAGALLGIASFAGLWDGQSSLFYDEGGIGAIVSVVILVSAVTFPGAFRPRAQEARHRRGAWR
jgi:hypothetical protein